MERKSAISVVNQIGELFGIWPRKEIPEEQFPKTDEERFTLGINMQNVSKTQRDAVLACVTVTYLLKLLELWRRDSRPFSAEFLSLYDMSDSPYFHSFIQLDHPDAQSMPAVLAERLVAAPWLGQKYKSQMSEWCQFLAVLLMWREPYKSISVELEEPLRSSR